MSLNFLENNLKLDASGLDIGNGATLTTFLTLDQRDISVTTFTVVVTPNADDSSAPYSATLVSVDGQKCLLTITFDEPIENVRFAVNRILVINGTFNLNVEINYSNSFVANNWTNASAILSIDDVDVKAALTSAPLNNRLRAILSSTINALNQIKNYIKYYSFREKYLYDIIDFAVASGNSLEAATCLITNDSNNNITSVTKSYATGRDRTEKIKINYTYTNHNLYRLRKRGDVYTQLTSESVSLLDSFTVNAIDGSGNTIYKLGTVTITRALTTYSIPNISDYNESLDDTDPINILSDYKYYKTDKIIGWTVA